MVVQKKTSTSISTEAGTTERKRFRAPKLSVVVVVIVLCIFAVVIVPRPFENVVPVSGRVADSYDLQQRRIVWRPSQALSSVVPPHLKNASLITPRLADGGTTLYFTLRTEDGQSDIFRSQLDHEEWQVGQPVASLNSSSDDVGAAPSADGKTLWLSSNRPGSTGGFDLYVSEWQDGVWTEPVNVGDSVNSTADEYDPAVSLDGRSLYFASNRLQQAASSKDSAAREWSSTLRHREANNFDLYTAQRSDTTAAWQTVAPLHSINRPDSNEGSPFVSSDGAFLYFASDRPVRSGEERNLDLFRSRIVGGLRSSPENLGPGINTSADETEPSLSPEGFTLVFSAAREGHDQIHVSRAEEVVVESGWDASNLKAVLAVWPQALIGTLLALLLAALFFATRRKFAQAAGRSQFAAGSVLFHVLLVFLLAIWNLPKVIEVMTSKTFDAEASTQLFDDNQHQSHEDGRAAYEKLADLQSIADAPRPEMTRTETEVFSVPDRTDNPLPTIPIEVARQLSPSRVMFVPPKQTQTQPKSTPSENAPVPAPARPTPVLEQAVVELTKVAVDLPEPAPVPGERPIATQIAMERSELIPDPVRFDIKNPDAPRLRPTSSTNLTPPAVEIGIERKAASLPSNPLEMRVAPIPDNTEFVELAEAVVLPAAPVETVEQQTTEPAPLMNVDKVSATTPKPVTFATDGRRLKTRQPQVFAELNDAPTADIENRPADPSTMPTLPARETAPTPVDNALAGVAQLDAEEVSLVKFESSESTQSEDAAVDEMMLTLDRTQTSGPPPLTPQEMSGPSSRNQQRIVVGALALETNNAPPAFHTLVSTLDRPHAKATAVLLAADSVGLRSMFTLRQGDTRKQFIQLFGGTEESEKAVNRGLVWIAQHQNADGSWSLNRFHENCAGKHPACSGHGAENSNAAATGLALLPLLAAGNTHVDGEYAKQVESGLQWLIDHQKPDGELLGPGDGQKMYSQGIAAIALCEAYGMTQVEEYHEPAQRALNYIIDAQHKQTGGWRYNPGEAGDTSVVGWQMMALKSGEMAGLNVPEATHEGIRRWLKSVEGNKPVGGLFGYTNRNVSPAMSAEGLLCLQFLGTGRNDSAMRAGADYLLTQLPELKQKDTSYYWYYGTQVMYHMQGNYWEEWTTALRDMVVETQIKDGHMAGTWEPIDGWEKRGGRLYATSMKLLLLEIYYRHLPLYEQLGD